jgi:hypothetical protein
MLKKLVLSLALALNLTGCLPIPAHNSVSLEDVPLQAAGVWENNLYLYGPHDTLNLTSNLTIDEQGKIGNLVWRGNSLAYLLFDENYVGSLWISVDRQAPFLLVNALDTLYPVSFTPDGQLLYAMANPNTSQSESAYMVDLFTIEPEIGSVPTFIGSFRNEEMGIGCGGGSSLPTDWQYWEEVGFGGQSLVLQMTGQGIVYSLDCVGERTGLLDLETGRDVELGENFGIATLSPDGTTLAGRIWDRTSGLPAQLVTVDLMSLEVQTYETVDLPDQVIWSADGASLFYSVHQMLDTMIPMTADEQAALRNLQASATDDPNGGFPLFAVGIRRFNLASGDDTRIYQGGEDAFSIGHMFALADKDVLVFSQIPNLQDWIAAIAAGRFDPNGPTNTRQEQIETVPVSVFALNLRTQRVTAINSGVNLYVPNRLEVWEREHDEQVSQIHPAAGQIVRVAGVVEVEPGHVVESGAPRRRRLGLLGVGKGFEGERRLARGSASAEQGEGAEGDAPTAGERIELGKAGGDGGRRCRCGQVAGRADRLRAVAPLQGSHGALELAAFAGGQGNHPLRW